MTVQDQVESFYRFAIAQIQASNSPKTVDELYDQWRFENQTSEEFEENVAAIQASIDDLNRGNAGLDFDEVIAEVRSRHNLLDS